MARDYAKKKRTQSKKKTAKAAPIPSWIWLITGALLGAFTMFLMRLSEVDQNDRRHLTPAIETSITNKAPTPKPPPAKQVAKQASTSQVQTQRKSSQNDEQPRFDFYDLLKETKVPVPKFSSTRDNTAKTNQKNIEYVLQVASFKNAQDAEQLRVQLLLLNLDAQIEQAKVRNGETWNRVLVGPFSSRSRLASARGKLISNSHEALVLKRSK